MTLDALREDALTTTTEGTTVLLSLPWIRSLPVASLVAPTLEIDGVPVDDLTVEIGGIDVAPENLGDCDEWWFLQDRVALTTARAVAAGVHDISVQFALRIPYLQTGPEGPLVLPFRTHAPLSTDAEAPASAPARTAARTAPPSDPAPGWVMSASAFNWTPAVIAARTDARDIAVDIVADGIASEIELEPGQTWRSFPGEMREDAEALRTRLADAGGRVSILGGSLDDWAADRRRTEDERLAFLRPQLEAAAAAGARGIRLPIGQAGPALLARALPLLDDLDITLFEEIQGPQTPGSPAAGAAIDHIVALDHARVRLVVDISMLMPALPESYLRVLERGGIPAALIDTLRHDWRDPATTDAVVALLRAGGVPPAVHTSFMNLLVRFGRADAATLAPLLPHIGAFHLKFWDLDDADGRVSGPIRDLGALLRGSDFRGTLCSEWGGHEWLDDDPAQMTRDHLSLARAALRG